MMQCKQERSKIKIVVYLYSHISETNISILIANAALERSMVHFSFIANALGESFEA